MFTNPVGGLTVGIVAGFLQVVYLNTLDKLMNTRFIVDTSGTFGMFILSGIQGGIWSAIFTAFQSVQGTASTFGDAGYKLSYVSGGSQIGALGVSIGISSLVGCLVGLILKFSNKNNSDDQFLDATYWLVEDDGISYRLASPAFDANYMESQINIR